ncbi:MAG TPA: zf-HC2 domain-containing protein [Acidobacteriota bacterium]|nr:zf-HC2 domain-containing protein [Acidobacteriota bacterium]
MRCRKVRSFLSAYCNDELTGRKRLAVREHLSTCCDCRREEAFYRSMRAAAGELAGLSVSSDFNTQLLNRIARERFGETRTRAYVPRRAPVVRWSRTVPVLAIVPVLVLAAAYWLAGGLTTGPVEVGPSPYVVGDDYLTVQPANNPNLTGALKKDWSLDKQLRWTDRMARISNSITERTGFGNLHLAGSLGDRAGDLGPGIPYVTTYYRVQPIIRVYQSSHRTSVQEDEEVY